MGRVEACLRGGSNWVEKVGVGPHHGDMMTTSFGLLLVGPVASVARVQQQARLGWGSSFGQL